MRLKQDAALPSRCIYCNIPVETPAHELALISATEPPTSPTITLKAHLCEIHRLVRAQMIVSVVGTLLMTASAAGFAALRGAELPIVFTISAVGVLGAWLRATVIRRRTPPLRLDHIESNFLYIAGVGPQFLESILPTHSDSTH